MNSKRIRRRFTAAFKAEVTLAALTERYPLAELATRYQSRWKAQLRQQAAQVFTEPSAAVAAVPDVEIISSQPQAIRLAGKSSCGPLRRPQD